MTRQGRRAFAASRADLWVAFVTCEPPEGHDCRPVAGASPTDLLARRLHVSPPMPPHGLREVSYHEIVAFEEGHWLTQESYTSQTEHTDTWRFVDAAHGGTDVVVDAVHRRLGLPGAVPLVETALDQSIQCGLDRLASSLAPPT